MSDTIAVVTGASSGVSATVARALGHADATVVAYVRGGDAFQPVVSNIEHDSGSTSVVRADVHDELDMERLMGTVTRAGGHIDVFVVNTAIAYGMSGEMSAPEDSYVALDDTFKINIRSVFAAAKEALPHVADDGHVLVSLGSTAREVKPGTDAYAIFKAVAEMLARQLVVDYDRTATVVNPGLVATNLTGGQGRDPDDAADLFVWAMTDADSAKFDDDIVDLKAWRRATC